MTRAVLLTLAGTAAAQPPAAGIAERPTIDLAEIMARSVSLECLDYNPLAGLCAWLNCGLAGCQIVVTPKIRHYTPDAVVSAYHETGENPWVEVRPLIEAAQLGLEGGITAEGAVPQHTNLVFKNVDAIGHPATALLSSTFGMPVVTCQSSAAPFVPYFISTLDTLAWRFGIPESFFPDALIPGRREIGGVMAPVATWGSLFPRSGFLIQAHDYKAAAVTAQRAANVITQRDQPHVYQPMVADPDDGYWPPGEAIEGDEGTARWQRLLPNPESDCHIFAEINDLGSAFVDPYAERLSAHGDYVWNLWRPYACCERAGQVLLFSIDF